MSTGIIERLESAIPSFGKSQRRVADYIIREPVQSAFYTIDKLAHASGVSTATVVRMAQSMGYSNYSAFQQDLQRFVQSKTSPLERIALVDLEEGMDLDLDKDQNNPFREVTLSAFENIQKTMSGLSLETVKKVSEYIISARHVYVVGQRGTKPLAEYLSFHLDRMFAKVDYLPSDPNGLPERMQRIGEGDLLIVNSFYRYSAYATRLAELAKNRGATIVAISDSYDSPLSPYADLQLVTYCIGRDFHNSGVGMMFLADILIYDCYKRAKDEVQRNLENAEPYVVDLRLKA